MGYGGAAISIFLSVFGAYSVGAAAIKGIEASYFAFLSEFQDNDKYNELLYDDENGSLMHDFLTYFAWDLFILNSFVFWHVFFLIAMGTMASLYILWKIQGYVQNEAPADVDITVGWKMLLFGVLFGTVDYLAGNAIDQNKDTILKMVGFTPTDDTDSTYTITNVETNSGVTTYTTVVTQGTEEKKDFFAM